MPFTYYVYLKTSRTPVQVNNVTAITIASPLIGNGTYRDEPPIVVGGGSITRGPEATVSISASIAGGVSPTTLGGTGDVSVTGDSSVLQSDSYLHTAPRFMFSPVGMVFFTTSSGIAGAPTGSTFSTTAPTVPAGNFGIVACDVVFKLDEVVGWSNTAPQGFSPTESIITSNP